MNSVRRADGFTMIEVMVALVIFAISLMGVMGLSTLSVYYNSMSRQISIASTVGAQLIDTLQHLNSTPEANFTSTAFTDSNPGNNGSPGSIDIVNDPPTSPAPEHTDSEVGFGGVVSGGITYRGYWNVVDIDQNSDGIVDLKEIVVIIRWKSANESRYHYTTLTTALYRPSGV
jgi:prepilin-type N-terminal cleavage/methylation domain-containing protein